MLHSAKHRAAILGSLILMLLFLCGCQAGGVGSIILPDTPSNRTAELKSSLLSAFNAKSKQLLGPEYIRGTDTAAEAVMLYIEQNSDGDASKAVAFLTENQKDEYGRANCADALQETLSPASGETYWVSYAFLPIGALDDNTPLDNIDFASAAHEFLGIGRKVLLTELDESYSPSNCQKTGFAIGVLNNQVFIIAVFVS